MRLIQRPSTANLRATRAEWERLLGRKTVEADWQRFFSEHPEALALSLPLKLQPWEFHALARPGRRDPDFWFCEQAAHHYPTHGLIELKTPDDPVVTRYRKGTPALSAEARGAIEQVTTYKHEVLPSLMPALPTSSVVFGNDAVLFVIIGLEEQVAARLAEDVFGHRLAGIPEGLKLLNFDSLLKSFSAHVPPKVLFLQQERELISVPERHQIDFVQTPSPESRKRKTMVMVNAGSLIRSSAREELEAANERTGVLPQSSRSGAVQPRERFGALVARITQLLASPVRCYEVYEDRFRSYVYVPRAQRRRKTTEGKRGEMLGEFVRVLPFEDRSEKRLGEASIEWSELNPANGQPLRVSGSTRPFAQVKQLW